MALVDKHKKVLAGAIILAICGMASYEPTSPLIFYLIVSMVVIILVSVGVQTYRSYKRWQLFIMQRVNMSVPGSRLIGTWKSPTSDHHLKFTEMGTIEAFSDTEKCHLVASYVIEGQTIKIMEGSELFGFIDHKTRRSPFDINSDTLTLYRDVDDTITLKKVEAV
ncbi:hypothetical protein J4N45_10645 [Vibrio sp. SCSIO 43140]|uniref:hypothetical protein n=1 Tax=Vibrio sp. SCSIO 43140 TaxID=2819100 RepID=UPI002075E56F|nr:hypothetical protein [Vibrio sp. SCSIO 43140]USD58989.1 hypothetical protein J4N45_10645 [Vibrio sp. SCSIO 43140]